MEKHPDKVSLQLSFGVHPTTLDPRKSGDFASSTLICLLFEGLTRCKGGSEVEPALAEKIDISPDKKTYVFHLRNSFWTDGQPVTAYDFEKSWKKILQPGFPSLSAYLLYPIKNAREYAKGHVSSEEVGVTALDSQTLRVELEKPTPYFLSLTAFPLFLPVPSHIEEENFDRDWTLMISNGPFAIEQLLPNHKIKLKKNPSFWNPFLSNLNEIQIDIVPNEETALQMFEKGELDWIGGPLSPLPPDSLQNLKREKKLHFIPMAASTFCAFNTEKFPFNNLSMRKAFTLAIDSKKIVEEITTVGQSFASRPLPPIFFGTSKPPLVSQDLEAAREYFLKALEELSIDPRDLSSLTLYYKPTQLDKRIAQALQNRWKEAFQIEIKIEQQDPKTHLKKLHERNFQLALASWIAQFHDPISLLERYKDKSNPKNYAGWENENFSSLLNQAEASLDEQERLSLLEKAEEILAENAILAPLYHWTAPTLFNDRIENFSTTTSGGILFERFSISRL